MELRLDPVVPRVVRGKDGRMRFNKGYHSPMKGKTFAEIYGEERARQITRKMSARQKGHPNYNPRASLAHARPCVAVHAGRLVARFGSCVGAARALGVSKNQVSRWLGGVNKPRNGWRWFYEDESRKWAELVNQ